MAKFSVSVTDDLYKQLEATAKARGETASRLVSEALERYLGSNGSSDSGDSGTHDSGSGDPDSSKSGNAPSGTTSAPAPPDIAVGAKLDGNSQIAPSASASTHSDGFTRHAITG